MGLDGVELVMALEESFGIELKDEEIVKTVTPRMVGDMLFSKLKATDKSVCQSQRTFYILRNALMKTFDLQRKEITPDTRFRDYIAESEEARIWPQLQAVTAVRRWPELERPLWMSRSLTIAGFAIFGTTVFLSIQSSFGAILGVSGGIALSVVFGIVAARLTRPFCLYIPRRYQTVRDLFPSVLTSDHVKWTRAQVSDLVKKVVMEQLGVSESQYTEDSNFINDFGMD